MKDKPNLVCEECKGHIEPTNYQKVGYSRVCCYCGIWLDEKNVGGIVGIDRSMCNNLSCLFKYVKEKQEVSGE